MIWTPQSCFTVAFSAERERRANLSEGSHLRRHRRSGALARMREHAIRRINVRAPEYEVRCRFDDNTRVDAPKIRHLCRWYMRASTWMLVTPPKKDDGSHGRDHGTNG